MKIVYTMIAGAHGLEHAPGCIQRMAAGGLLDSHENLPVMVFPVDPYDGTPGDLKPGALDPYRLKPYEIKIEEPKKEDVWGMDANQKYTHAYKRCLSVLDEFPAEAILVFEDVAVFAKNWNIWLKMTVEQLQAKHKGHWMATLSMFTPEAEKAFKFGFQWVGLSIQAQSNAVGPAAVFGKNTARSFAKELDKDIDRKFHRVRDEWILDERIPYYSTAPSLVRYIDAIEKDEEVGYKYIVKGFKERLPKLRVT